MTVSEKTGGDPAAGEVSNQTPAFEDVNFFTSDRVLQAGVEREGAAFAFGELAELGSIFGAAGALEEGRLANIHPPVLETHDARGARLDRVEFHPAYHACMKRSMAAGLHCGSWEHLARDEAIAPGTNVARAAKLYMAAQMEAGHICPLTMTNAAVAVLMAQPDMAGTIVPKILAREYDPSFRHMSDKSALTIGMGMTEKQGGTDVRGNTTRAEPGDDGAYRITGHKWFFSAPMCDAFLVLAQAPGGLSCFMMPRVLPEGEVNALHFQRLKTKLGNRSNASSEVEFADAYGWLIGEEGRGVATIVEMVNYTRLDCAVSSSGLMRFCLASAVHHARHRSAFGKRLVEQPLMAAVLCDMALDVEAATMLALRLARSFDNPDDEGEIAWRRLMTPVTKYWVCKTAPALGAEAMECHGGNGYVEAFPVARVYREMPVNAIWEGSGNVMCLDVLRVLQNDADALDLVFLELQELAAGHDPLLRHIAQVRDILHNPREIDRCARTLVEGLALAGAGALMHANAGERGEAFVANRIRDAWPRTYGAGRATFATTEMLDGLLV